MTWWYAIYSMQVSVRVRPAGPDVLYFYSHLHSSVRYLVNQQCIKPLCDLLNVNDGKIIHVALDGLDNILRAGQEEFQSDAKLTTNPYCILIEEGDG
jgi:hypothetical protein